MDDADLFDRMHASLLASGRLITAGASDSHLIERDGLTAGIVPSTPNRSVFNSVIYRSPSDITGALDELAWAYDEGGVRAWTVWVPERDREVAALLGRQGHSLDADPAAMVLELERFDGEVSPEVEIDLDPDVSDIARINDEAYGYGGDFVRALGELPKGAANLYTALLDGAPAAGLLTVDHEQDCWVTFVATYPEARGRGLASALMTKALLDARDRGCTTTSLQATKMGQPVYERLGYRDFGPVQMWERRKA
jgi:GNAT superfamily N-acetyltransferase